jgi:hypothetical protein
MRRFFNLIEGVSEMTGSGGEAENSVILCQNISQTVNCAEKVQAFDAIITNLHGITDLLLIRPS